MSFFDDDDDDLTAARPPRPRRAPPRRATTEPARHAQQGDDQVMIRRRRMLAGGGALALLIVVLLIAGIAGGGEQEEAEHFNQEMGAIMRESDQQVGGQFFQALAAARSEPGGGSIESRLNEYGAEEEKLAAKAAKLSAPAKLTAAARYALQVLDLRLEGIRKTAGRIGVALSGQSESASAYKQVAGAMEIFLASDVIYSQRVAPLVEEALSADGASSQSVYASHFLPNLGWLEASTVAERTGGHLVSSARSGASGGTQAANITSVAVGSNTLAVAPELNHIHSGVNPTFTVKLENTAGSEDTNVTVEVAVTAQGKRYSAFNTVAKIAAGQSATVEVPLENIPLGSGAKITVEAVPPAGAKSTESSLATFDAAFS